MCTNTCALGMCRNWGESVHLTNNCSVLLSGHNLFCFNSITDQRQSLNPFKTIYWCMPASALPSVHRCTKPESSWQPWTTTTIGTDLLRRGQMVQRCKYHENYWNIYCYLSPCLSLTILPPLFSGTDECTRRMLNSTVSMRARLPKVTATLGSYRRWWSDLGWRVALECPGQEP